MSALDDSLERLFSTGDGDDIRTCDLAVEELAALRARLAVLENALDPFAQAGLRVKDMSIGERKHFHADDHISTSALIEAAAALGEKKEG